MEEIWKPVIGFEGHYEVSSLGNVRSLDKFINTKGGAITKKCGKLLSPSSGRYRNVMLWSGGIQSPQQVHRLVAIAFIANPENKPQVNHIDGDKHNNMLSNLEWCNNSENAIHAFKLGLRKPKGYNSDVSKEERKLQIMELKGKGLTYDEIARIIGIHRVSVCRIATDYYKRKVKALGPI